MTTKLSHIDAKGQLRMVNIEKKEITHRVAVAKGLLTMKATTLHHLTTHDYQTPKGDILATARLAGIMAAKNTATLIPLCHPLPLHQVMVDIQPNAPTKMEVVATVHTLARTGVEMEALTAVSVACLTLYDMLKAMDKSMTIHRVRLVDKKGGTSKNTLKSTVKKNVKNT